MAKTFTVNTEEMIGEHKRIIPELRKAGLKEEADEQAKELVGIKKKKLKTIINKK